MCPNLDRAEFVCNEGSAIGSTCLSVPRLLVGPSLQQQGDHLRETPPGCFQERGTAILKKRHHRPHKEQNGMDSNGLHMLDKQQQSE